MKLSPRLAVSLFGIVCAITPALAVEVAIPDGATLAASLGDQQGVTSKNSVYATSKNSVYMVCMAEDPVTAYDGSIAGFRATKPKKNKKLDPNSPAVRAYGDYLIGKHDAALNKAGGGKKLYSYKYVLNGFAAELDKSQLDSLRNELGVVSVTPDQLMKPDTISTPAMLKLEAGIWDELGGTGNAGEDVIVGIIDSGVWPENPSFSDRSGSDDNNGISYQQIPGWNGKCTPGESFPASDCNQKLIGAQWFNSAAGGDAAIKELFPYEYASARDADGHGSHTASTAAGNSGVDAVINGNPVGTVSGVAPRARIAIYKVCWGRGGEGGCSGVDSIAAIDQAVADGVDVINYSISGSLTNFLDPVEVALLFAADAGVFVAASAGNSGPGASTVAHNSPWLTTVAAGTHDRGYEATITDGKENMYDGVSVGEGAMGELVYSGDAGDVLCNPGALDPAVVGGNIVLCDRGAIARVDKSLAVVMAGGIGMILANSATSLQSLNADFHMIPSVHVDDVNGAALRAYSQTVGASAVLSPRTTSVAEASQVADFSSRGPALAGEGDLLKPDIMAPGVDVVAAVSPVGSNGNNFDAKSGTSMSSPHMAGLGALLKQLHPSWSPAAIKSAFMTTATQQTNQGNPIGGGAFAYGAGFVVPNSAADPGLVYDSGFDDWLGFLCGTGQLQESSGRLQASQCPAIGFGLSDLNYPSIAIGSLAGLQTVTRTVTNVSPSSAVYTVSTAGLTGIDVTVTPGTLSLAPGESGSYEVTLETAGAVLDAYAEGGITWTDGDHIVRSPVVVRPVKFAFPEEVSFTEASGSGSGSFDVRFGYTGDYSAYISSGLVAATTVDGNVVDDPADSIGTALSTGVGMTIEVVVVPAGATLTRISLFDDYTDGVDDLDLYVFGPDTAGFPYQGGSTFATSAEQVDLDNPAPGVYLVVVHGSQTDGPDANYALYSWSLTSDTGNAMVINNAPASATLGTTGGVRVDWAGLTDEKYLGVLLHEDGVGEIGRTVLNVQND